MNIRLTFLCSSLLFITQSVLASPDSGPVPPKEVNLPPEIVFIPRGFDNNDKSQVVLWGYLPNTCYRTGPVKTEIDQAQKKITITHSAYLYSDEICLEMAIPYTLPVDLGILSEGHYEVFIKTEQGDLQAQGGLPIRVSKASAPDDYPYALIEDVEIEPHSGSQPASIVIKGSLPSPIFYLKEFKILETAPNVIEILPIMGKHPDIMGVPMLQPFAKKLDLPQTHSGNTLIHVRSLNGEAVNKVVSL